MDNPCQWFLMCVRPATRTREHPILGAVPICVECDERLREAESKGR